MPIEILEAVTTVVALIGFGLLCGAYLCPKHFDENRREWTVRRRRRNDEKQCATRAAADAAAPERT
jgi:hypothetical protein